MSVDSDSVFRKQHVNVAAGPGVAAGAGPGATGVAGGVNVQLKRSIARCMMVNYRNGQKLDNLTGFATA